MEKFAVGIDLGTTYSAVAVFRNGNAEIIHNDQGNRITPSCVAFTSAQRIVGDGAAFQAGINPTNTIYGVKRLMGRKFDDKEIQKDIRSWPFRVMEQKDQIKIEVDYKGERKTFFPEEISAAILEKMKNAAEAYLGVKIKDVVITCPAYFNNTQRQATKDAAQIAGLNILRMINEPTAAAIAFGLSVNRVEEKNVLIFDFGGGTFDVSILKIKHKEFTVRATNGDTHLGGEDFDQRMVDFFVEEFKRKQNRDISKDKGLMRQLKTHCERAKRTLSFAVNAEFMLEGANLSGNISRSRFEEMNYDLFEKAVNLVQTTLKDAKMTKNQIDDVVLVGGSSRIPKIQGMLSVFFGGKNLSQRVNPDEAVALGAAIQAGMLQSDVSVKLKGLKLCDVCPLSLGSENADGRFVKIIERNTPIPVKASDIFYTGIDYQTSGSVIIYEGERTMARDNHLLGEINVDNIPPRPRGEASMEHIYEIDANGILQVTSHIPLTGSKKSITITNKSRISTADANRLVKEAEKFRSEDAKHAARLVAYNAFEEYLYDIKRKVDPMLKGPKQKKAKAYVDLLSVWLSHNRSATIEEFETKKSDLEKLWKNL